jgi:transmembrane sensor
VRLADGTSVWLKAGSQLRYPAAFEAGERRVELRGEGYFEVTKNRHRPFVVAGGPVDVKVLGTKFDFAVNSHSQLASVSLIEGAVEVRDVKRNARLLLKPNQRVHLNTRTGQQRMETMDTRIVAAWHDRLIPFTNANVSAIARTIEQLYGVKVHVAADVDNGETYSGAVYLASNIDSVLKLVQSTVPISFQRKGNAVWIYKESAGGI